MIFILIDLNALANSIALAGHRAGFTAGRVFHKAVRATLYQSNSAGGWQSPVEVRAVLPGHALDPMSPINGASTGRLFAAMLLWMSAGVPFGEPAGWLP
ncbi:hypothetical protein EMIT047CA2_40265 [Pseudomonas soli]|jgi:hypothetical protein